MFNLLWPLRPRGVMLDRHQASRGATHRAVGPTGIVAVAAWIAAADANAHGVAALSHD